MVKYGERNYAGYDMNMEQKIAWLVSEESI